jgi:signal transduction histidine kinase/DNA-binding response OmpR family regulator
LQYTPYTLPTFASAVVIAWIVRQIVTKYRDAPGAAEFAVLGVLMAWASLTYVGELSSATLQAKALWLDLRYVGFGFMPLAVLVFALKWAGFERWTRFVYMMALVPCITVALAWTNDWHHLVAGPSQLIARDGYTLRTAESHIAFWLFALWSYACLLAATVLYAHRCVTSPPHRRQGALLIAATLLPWLLNVGYLFLGNYFDAGYDISHIGYAIAAIVWLFALRQARLFDLVPVARERVFESIGDPVFVVDEMRRVIDHNPAAQRLLQRSERLAGIALPALLGDAVAGELLSSSQVSLLGRVHELHRFDIASPRRRGATVVILRDITERKQQEAAREEAMRIAQEASRAQTQFLARMSHEVRSPLHGIVGAAQLLVSRELDAQSMRYARAVAAASGVLLALVDELLDFSKLDSERLHTQLADIDARPVLDEVALMFSAMAERKHLKLEVLVPAALPVRADGVRLRQVLANLVSNAVKFTDSGSITIAASQDCEVAWFEVRDTGIGIPQASQAQVFEPFVQLEVSPRGGASGTGLGLSIAKRMVTLMGGAMTLESGPGRGSIFRFSLQAVAQVPQEAGMQHVPLTRRGRVLVVDDNEVNLLVTEGLLEKEGCTVTTARDARAALEILTKGHFDLVLTDIRMPGMDGYEFAAAARALDGAGHFAVVAVTADVYESAREQALRSGMDDWLGKPLDPVLLRRVLDRWLPRGAALDEPVALREYLAADRGVYARVVDAFRRSTPVEVQAISAAVSAGDWRVARERAHALKGAALVLGATGLAVACSVERESDWASEGVLARIQVEADQAVRRAAA